MSTVRSIYQVQLHRNSYVTNITRLTHPELTKKKFFSYPITWSFTPRCIHSPTLLKKLSTAAVKSALSTPRLDFQLRPRNSTPKTHKNTSTGAHWNIEIPLSLTRPHSHLLPYTHTPPPDRTRLPHPRPAPGKSSACGNEPWTVKKIGSSGAGGGGWQRERDGFRGARFHWQTSFLPRGSGSSSHALFALSYGGWSMPFFRDLIKRRGAFLLYGRAPGRKNIPYTRGALCDGTGGDYAYIFCERLRRGIMVRWDFRGSWCIIISGGNSCARE